ncbi:MAG TPA: peptidylprolyl isomerase [Candidatus Dormibacteraeota bacterium]|nr:peptidylprolyl isomerase [Candidatus Dormibacteraeota bacterium]
MNLKFRFLAGVAILLAASLALRAQQQPPPQGQVIDRIIATVNDDIITSHQYQTALAALREQIKHDCASCSAAQLDTQFQEKKKNVLRDMIDQSLLVQRAKDQGINVDIDVVKQLDRIRQQYHLPTMDALQQAVQQSGMDWNDYKDTIRRQLLTQQLIQQDVGGSLQIGRAEIQKYYDAHKSQFNRPESVVLREIFLSTKGMTPVQIAAARKKIDNLRQRVSNGDDFGQLAKLYSQGSTAQKGGELGTFQRGELAPDIENAVFKLQHDQMTPVIQTPAGFELLQVEQHYQAGIQPLDAVLNDVENDIYLQKIGPALRAYLEKLRGQSYIKMQPGYIDTAAVPETPIEEVTPSIPGQGNSKKKGSG